MNEQDLMDELKRLDSGKSITLTIDGETIQYTKPVENVSCEEHYYVEAAPEGEMSACKCQHCPNGILYDPKEALLKDGKLIPLGARL